MKIKEIIETNPVIMAMLKNCPDDILSHWEIKNYLKDYIVCYQDMVYEYFHIIVEGQANIYIMAESGKKYSQSIYTEGNYFGELEIFDNRPYICSVEAITDLKVIRIHRKYFLQWIERDKHFTLHMMKTLCDGFYKLSKKAGENTLYSLKYRICNYLIACIDNGIRQSKGIRIDFNKEQLSDQLVVTQRSINRILQQLKEKDLIEVGSNFILIIDLEGLKEEKRISQNE